MFLSRSRSQGDIEYRNRKRKMYLKDKKLHIGPKMPVDRLGHVRQKSAEPVQVLQEEEQAGQGIGGYESKMETEEKCFLTGTRVVLRSECS
jgi:hypothetical protein